MKKFLTFTMKEHIAAVWKFKLRSNHVAHVYSRFRERPQSRSLWCIPWPDTQSFSWCWEKFCCITLLSTCFSPSVARIFPASPEIKPHLLLNCHPSPEWGVESWTVEMVADRAPDREPFPLLPVRLFRTPTATTQQSGADQAPARSQL